MRKVELRAMESNKYEVIKKLIDTNGNKKNAMLKIGCSLRNINRLIAKYKSQGKKGFIHGNRDRKPANTTNEDLKCKIIDLYNNKYRDANIRHFSELIKEHENISISTTTIHNWLHELNLFSPKATRITKSKINKRIKNLKNKIFQKLKSKSLTLNQLILL
jgi:transposase